MGDQLAIALNQAQVEAVEPGMTDSIFALEGCRTTVTWVDLKRQIQNMIISYSGDAIQPSLCEWPGAEAGHASLRGHGMHALENRGHHL